METTIQEQKKIRYYRNVEEEEKVKHGSEAIAQALNEVYSHYVFKEISEIPAQVSEWRIKRTLETNPKLAALAKIHKLESLKIDVPDWIEQACASFTRWHSLKSTHQQYLKFVSQRGETFEVDTEAMELEFENNTAYRKYLNDEQLTRLDQCRRFISLLEETQITFPHQFSMFFGLKGNPWVRVVGDRYVPSRDYVLAAGLYPNAPMVRDADYELKLEV